MIKRIKQNFWFQIFTIYTRYALGGAMVFASIIKIKGKRFTTDSQEDSPFGTSGHFFETMYQTGEYWEFLGWAQLMAGFFLMTQSFSKLGAVVNFGIILNIFVITISMEFGFTPVITFSMLLASIWLIFWHWGELRIFLNYPYLQESKLLEDRVFLWRLTGFILFLFTCSYRIYTDEYDPIFWLLWCFAIGLLSFAFRIVKRNFEA